MSEPLSFGVICDTMITGGGKKVGNMCKGNNHWNSAWHIVLLRAERDLSASVAISSVTSMMGAQAVSKPGAPLSILYE